jgi:hypothetical protein
MRSAFLSIMILFLFSRCQKEEESENLEKKEHLTFEVADTTWINKMPNLSPILNNYSERAIVWKQGDSIYVEANNSSGRFNFMFIADSSIVHIYKEIEFYRSDYTICSACDSVIFYHFDEGQYYVVDSLESQVTINHLDEHSIDIEFEMNIYQDRNINLPMKIRNGSMYHRFN